MPAKSNLARLSILGMLFWLLPSVLMTGCTIWGEPKTETWSNITGGEQYERLLWKEIKAKNWPEVESRLAPTFVNVDQAGAFDKTTTLEHLKQLELNDYTLGNFDVQPDGNLIVVTYTNSRHGRMAGHAMPEGAFRCMTVWQQGKKGWTASAHSETAITPQSAK